MKRKLITFVLIAFVFFATSFQTLIAQTGSTENQSSTKEPNSTELEELATQVLTTYCVSCHGPENQEANLRFDALETMDAVDRQNLFRDAHHVIHLSEMPPDDAKQPTQHERKSLLSWFDHHLNGNAAKALAEKLRRFEFGNVVNHNDLFSGEHAHLPGFSFDRRWMISEFIFNERVNRLLDYSPTRTIYGTTVPVHGDSGVHWSPKTERGNKFRRTITNPFLLSESVGVRYGIHDRLTTGHLLTMLGNAKRIAGHMSSEDTMKSRYPAMFALMEMEFEQRAALRRRENFLKPFSSMNHLLKELYGKQHESLLPKWVRTEIPYPGPPKHSTNGIQKRHENLDFLGRFDQEDIRAILQGITTYKKTAYRAKEDTARTENDRHGNPVYAPYVNSDREEFENIILQCERDWCIEGVTQYRIQNRITTMKLFFDTWDMNRLYTHIEQGNFSAPKYAPLDQSEMNVIGRTIKKNRKQGDHYLRIIEKCMTEWKNDFRIARESSNQADHSQMSALVVELYTHIFERQPTNLEIKENIELFQSYLAKLDRQDAIQKLIESLILSTEFAYRDEFGQGDPDNHGRRMMSPRNASYAIAYALTDASPDAELIRAAAEGQLNTREDYEREVRRILNRRDRWAVIDESVQAANLNASVTNLPIRKLRFVREFFGYPKALSVFKDDSRFGAGRHEQAVSRLIDEADLLVEHILKDDQQVFEQLLTTDRFYIYHSGNNQEMQNGADELKRVYSHFKDLDWKDWEPDDVAPHKEFLSTVWEFSKQRNKDNKSYLNTLKRMMTALELHFGQGQASGMPYMKMPMGFWHGGNVLGRTGQQMRGEQVTTYWNLDWKTWDYPAQQPAKIHNRKGLLTHPAWLIAHSQNLETDPIHRGKWIREKLLAGTIPDVPITVDAVIPPDRQKTLRQRMEDRTGDDYCWRCHQKMDPLGFPFEIYDDFGRFRKEENLEHPENLIKPAKRGETNTFGATLPIYKTLPVDARGNLVGTNDPKLDGEVKDAFDLIDRLAKSDRVRQSIIRHAFRYFMGRNEMLSDSQTLINAEKAYIESHGSFDEVIVSLLTSDSFIYRKPKTKE